MWLWMALGSALLLGVYDVAKKQTLRRNGVMWVLFTTTALSTLLLTPHLEFGAPQEDYLLLLPKAALVTLSWISGLIALKRLPITTVSTVKASRPMFVVLFSLIIFGERLNLWQWGGVVIVIAALFMLSSSSKKEGIYFTKDPWMLWLLISVITGVVSALYDKYIIARLEPMFVQAWSNMFISCLMGIVLLVKQLKDGAERERFHWDWFLLVVAVTIVCADALYFLSLDQDGSMLSIISLIRRSSVIVTFALGAWIFKEKNIKAKALDLAILLVGMGLLLYGSMIQ